MAAAMMMGVLAFCLLLAATILLAEEGYELAESIYEAMKDRRLAILVAFAIVTIHVAASRYQVRRERVAMIDADYKTSAIWPGALYTFGVIALAIYASKSVG